MEARLTDHRINLKQLVERLKFLGCQTFDEGNLCAAASYGASRKPQSLDGLHRRQSAAKSAPVSASSVNRHRPCVLPTRA